MPILLSFSCPQIDSFELLYTYDEEIGHLMWYVDLNAVQFLFDVSLQLLYIQHSTACKRNAEISNAISRLSRSFKFLKGRYNLIYDI